MKTPSLQKLHYLDGQQIIRWTGTEMALVEGTQDSNDDDAEATGTVQPEPAQWSHPSIPFLQFINIDIQLSNGTTVRLLSQLDDGSGYYGLYLLDDDNADVPCEEEPGSIFRTRELTELPLGIATVTVVRQDGPDAIIEARIVIDAREIRLLAAEVHLRTPGVFDIVEGDESILLQLDGVRPA